jgi:hypothetical protein
MPAHSSHLLQPLDIGCFAVLKRAYGSLVSQKMRLGINHIDKLDFLHTYPKARIDAFKPDTIKNSFAAASLVPFDPDRVLSKLDIQLNTPTPAPSRPGSQSSQFTPKTPGNVTELLKQASSVKGLLRQRSISPPTPSKTALNQLIKGCQMVIHHDALRDQEIRDLRAANAVQKQKRARTKRHTAYQGGVSVQEAQELIRSTEQPIHPVPPVPDDLVQANQTTAAPPTRRAFTCSICNQVGHRLNQCTQR